MPLLVTCDPYSRIMDRTDRDTVALFGDAATATWLSREKGGVIGKTDFGTDGTGAENLIVRVGGAAKPLTGIYHQQGDRRVRPRSASFDERPRHFQFYDGAHSNLGAARLVAQ